MNIFDYLSIGWHLLRREMHVLAQSWRKKATNAFIIIWMFYLSFGCFLPPLANPMPQCIALPKAGTHLTFSQFTFDIAQTFLVKMFIL